MFSSCILQSSTSLRLIKTKFLGLNFYSGKCLNPHLVPGHALFYLFCSFYYIRQLLAGHRTAWRQSLLARNSPFPPWEIDHHTGPYVPCSLRTVCGFFNVPHNLYMQGLWDGAYGLSSLSEKTRKSNRLQMSLQRQHFLVSYYLKTPSVGPAGTWTSGLPLSRPALIRLDSHQFKGAKFFSSVNFKNGY